MQQALNDTLLQQADLCVRCGLCLPKCPTYLDTRQEGDGPRGRISLIQALAAGQLPATPSLEGHLDGCLSCRACETACPAKVPYGEMIDGARMELGKLHPKRLRLARLSSAILGRRRLRNSLAIVLRIYRLSGIARLVEGGMLGKRLARLTRKLPLLPWPRAFSTADRTSGHTSGQGDRVWLFGGCVTELAERSVLTDAVKLLEAAGYSVVYPESQGCCGALLQHAGDRNGARHCMKQQIAAFPGDEPITAITPGCAATLRDYATFGDAVGSEFSRRVTDIYQLLVARAERLAFKPLNAKAALHMPCTQRNALRGQANMEGVLGLIPDLELHPLDAQQRCCGAAGLHFITNADASDRLLQHKLDATASLQPEFILSGNIGCSLHLMGGLSERKLPTPVIHPLTLLARQLSQRPLAPCRLPAADDSAKR